MTASEWSEAASLFPVVASVLGGIAVLCVVVNSLLAQDRLENDGGIDR